LALVGCQLDRAAEFHASGLGALAAIVCAGADKLPLELSKVAENGQQYELCFFMTHSWAKKAPLTRG
jgi:hypothetical protein